MTAIAARPRRLPKPSVGATEAAAPLPGGRGWILLGWTPSPWAPHETLDRIYAHLSLGTVTGDVTTVFFGRPDLPPGAAGFCAVLQGAIPPRAALQSIEIPALAVTLPILARDPALTAIDIATEARKLIRQAHGHQDFPLLALLPRPAFDGRDTLAALWPPIHRCGFLVFLAVSCQLH